MITTTPNIVMMISCSISMLACLVLFGSFHKTKKKPVSLKMVVILSFSDFMISLFAFLWATMYDLTGTEKPLLIMIFMFSFVQFSIVWSCNIARFVYKSIDGDTILDQNKYFRNSFIFSIALTVGLDLLTSYTIKEYMQSICSMVVLATLILMTLYYYIKAISIYKHYPIEFRQYLKPAIRNLYLIASAQLFTVAPSLIEHLFRPLDDFSNTYTIVVLALGGLSGFVNASIYLFSSRDSFELSSKDETDASISQVFESSNEAMA